MATPRPHFKLKDPRAHTPTLISLVIYSENNRVMYSTGQKIIPALWNSKDNIPITTGPEFMKLRKVNPNLKQELDDLKSILERNISEAKSTISYLTLQKIPLTLESFREIFEKNMNINPKNSIKNRKIPTLNEFIEIFIQEIKSGNRSIKKGTKYKFSTVKNYLSFQVLFKEYQDSKKKIYDFRDITYDFYIDFQKYCNKKLFSPNTFGRHIKHLKVIMRAGFDLKYHDNHEIDRRDFKTLSQEVDEVYLTEEEINKLYDLDLSEKKPYEIARDVFIIGCRTAQRFSDYSRISNENLKTNKDGQLLELIQIKTNEKIIIPVHPQVSQILSKYQGKLPKVWEQKLNKYIKEVCKIAEINDPIIRNETHGGLIVEKKYKKHELVKTHTARRTGATLMYLANISTLDIMKITGHKTERQFLRYIKVTKEETAQRLINHPYFNPHLRIAN
jgi:hypothetical protein